MPCSLFKKYWVVSIPLPFVVIQKHNIMVLCGSLTLGKSLLFVGFQSF